MAASSIVASASPEVTARSCVGIFTETAGGVTTGVLAKLAARGDLDPDERVVLVITGEGLKTLDAVRGTFAVHEIEPAAADFAEAFADEPVPA